MNGKFETVPVGEHIGKYDVQIEYSNLITPIRRTTLEANRVMMSGTISDIIVLMLTHYVV